jgi:hypothetical protein
VAQKRLVRALAGERYWPTKEPVCASRPLFELLNLLPVYSIFLFESCKFVRQFPHYFKTVGAVHGHATRARDNIYVSAQNMVLSNSDPYCSVASLYNSLPGRVEDIKNLKEYVKALKEFVMDKKFYCFDDFVKRM